MFQLILPFQLELPFAPAERVAAAGTALATAGSSAREELAAGGVRAGKVRRRARRSRSDY